MSIVKKEEKPIDVIRQTLTTMSKQFELVLPPSISVDKFVRIVVTAVQNNPKLLEVNRNSLFSAAMQAAQDGLLADGKEGAIVPYKNVAKFMPMINGICKRIKQSGELKTMDAVVVYENDKYRAWTDERGQHFEYEKTRQDPGNPICTFAYAITKDGGLYFEEVDESQMADIENCSKAGDSPWKGPFRDEMKRKSALRRLAKYRLPVSSDVLDLIQREDEMYELPAKKEYIPYSPPQYIPGIEPMVTVENFVSENKGLPDHKKIFDETLEHLFISDQKEYYEKLKAELTKQCVVGYEAETTDKKFPAEKTTR